MRSHLLKTYRDQNGIKQSFIARVAGISASQVCLIEKGLRWASPSLARRLHVATNGAVPMGVFLRPEATTPAG